jgi:hypothetical protein
MRPGHNGTPMGGKERGQLVLTGQAQTNFRRSPGLQPGLLLSAAAILVSAWAGAAPTHDLRLASELCDEGNWPACVVECRRVLAADPHCPEALSLQARAQARMADPAAVRSSVWLAPGRLVIRFYRRQIAPALGRRCSLNPSCSEYALQALRRHGLLALAMYADRGVREPSIVADAERVVFVNGLRKFADPLDAHDWWMR